MGHQIFTPNKLGLAFRAANQCAKFYQNRQKCSRRSGDGHTDWHTDSQTQVIL